MKFRIKLIQKLIHINELLFFYTRLRKFYKKNLNKSQIKILDVGSNKGQSIDFFLGINKNVKIFAFEPNKTLYHYLIKKYKNHSNIVINNFGVSNISGVLDFRENILDETSTFETLNLESEYLEKKAKILGVKKENLVKDIYKVDVISLNDFLKKFNSEYFDVLKVDVEGHELQVLQGLFSRSEMNSFIRFIQIEQHNDDMYDNYSNQREIVELLSKNGYFEISKIKHGFGNFHEIIYEFKIK
jgi:FkbM family methyltransferase